jgi:hypothetical protein
MNVSAHALSKLDDASEAEVVPVVPVERVRA